MIKEFYFAISYINKFKIRLGKYFLDGFFHINPIKIIYFRKINLIGNEMINKRKKINIKSFFGREDDKNEETKKTSLRKTKHIKYST